jgi:putative transposase
MLDMSRNPKAPTITRQCELLSISRSGAYYSCSRDPAREQEELQILKLMDKLYTEQPSRGRYGLRDALELEHGITVNHKRVRRLMAVLGIEAIYPKPRKNTSTARKEHKKYPYLLRNIDITYPDQVWCSDITYIPLNGSFVYLAAVMDWYSRCVLSWRLSNTMDSSFCVEALQEALRSGRRPVIFNTDQGSQFTSEAFTGLLKRHGIAVSMDGVGRAFDNIMIERLWRSVKYENVYIRSYQNPTEARFGLSRYFDYYNHLRRHRSLGRRTRV